MAVTSLFLSRFTSRVLKSILLVKILNNLTFKLSKLRFNLNVPKGFCFPARIDHRPERFDGDELR